MSRSPHFLANPCDRSPLLGGLSFAVAPLRFAEMVTPSVGDEMTLRRELVLRPHLLQMDQATLARTKQPMLKRGKREELFFGEHGIREMG